MEKNWFVFYTKSRHEKKVRDLLERNGFEVFLPMQKVMRQWSDRKKKVEVPLFNSYIFVHTHEHLITDILQTPGIAWLIRHNGKPAVLRKVEYEMIQRFINSGLFFEAQPLTERLEAGDKAKIIDGPLAGITGILSQETTQDNFHVILEGIHQTIRVILPANLLQKI